MNINKIYVDQGFKKKNATQQNDYTTPPKVQSHFTILGFTTRYKRIIIESQNLNGTILIFQINCDNCYYERFGINNHFFGQLFFNQIYLNY
ncbi:hypothetical protein pb186bvf_019822 [Paramecium bursaria]